MNNLQTFAFEGGTTVTTLERNGQAWFVAADVCKALGIRNSRHAVSRLDSDEKDVVSSDTLGGRQETTIINESGLYSLIFTSRKESAKQFKKWVTSEVLPAVRKHGGYIVGMESLSQENQAMTTQAVQQEAERVRLRNLEEKDARREALRFMRK